jgi:hypothetical protein
MAVIKGLFIEWAVKVRFGVDGDASGHVIITKASAVTVDVTALLLRKLLSMEPKCSKCSNEQFSPLSKFFTLINARARLLSFATFDLLQYKHMVPTS